MSHSLDYLGLGCCAAVFVCGLWFLTRFLMASGAMESIEAMSEVAEKLKGLAESATPAPDHERHEP